MTDPNRGAGEGRLEEAEGRWRLRFVRVLEHSPEKVWRALTEEEHLAAWFPTTIEGELRAGAPLQFRFRDSDLPATMGEMIECEAPRVLEFTWGFSEEDVDQPERSRFELAREGDGCRLTFTTTYDLVGKSARDAAGWHVCFDLLAGHLAGEPPAAPSPDLWKPLERRYAARFGPEAATLGPPESMKEYVEKKQGG
jgi:uncharacterized protein YndB with AHSA1/START domain